MRTVLHLSDLHFGRIEERLLLPLTNVAEAIKPDLVVVSGDLTQRARSSQFRAAKEFLDSLPRPQIVVPGNHDVPMHNPIARFLYPLAGYRQHFSDDPEPFFQDDEIAVLGLNSSRSLTIQDGRLNDQQIDRLIHVFRPIPPNVTKILVCHHPFSLSAGDERHRVVGGAARVLEAMATCKGDIVLTGHLHTTSVSSRELKDGESGWSVILSQAGTSTSTRLRGQAPAFNVLRIDAGVIDFQPYTWDDAQLGFIPAASTTFTRDIRGWQRMDEFIGS